jgi:acetyl esterase/lipase
MSEGPGDQRLETPVTMAPLVPVSPDYEVKVHDVEYQRFAGEPLLVRIYRPVGVEARTAVLDVHGGAWVNGDRTSQQGTSQGMAAAGSLVVSVDFRQPPVAGYPASIQDVNLAIRWLKLHAGELGAAAGARFGLYGGSSGGHVVLLAAMRPHHPLYTALSLPGGEGIDASVDFVVTDAPVSDPQERLEVAIAQGQDQMVERHGLYWTDPESPIDANPTRILERQEAVDLPPLFLSQGDEDASIPIDMTRKFAALYEAAGGHVELLVFPGVGHGFILFEPSRPESVQQVEGIRAFIQKVATDAE